MFFKFILAFLLKVNMQIRLLILSYFVFIPQAHA